MHSAGTIMTGYVLESVGLLQTYACIASKRLISRRSFEASILMLKRTYRWNLILLTS